MFGLIATDATYNVLLERAAANLVGAAGLYRALLGETAIHRGTVERIRTLKQAGEQIGRELLDQLSDAFITPFEPQDLTVLFSQIEHVMDHIDNASRCITDFRIGEPTRWLIQQSDFLLKSCRAIDSVTPRLRNLSRVDGVYELLADIRQLDDIGEDHVRSAAAELFTSGSDVIRALKLKGVSDHTERAINGCSDIASTIRSIAMKAS